ncbi:MAG TPA: radical SAM protein, partial [Vicinamibacterales bacterium]|nr:radical SAM protein [Vicinamibacterales bacterium]
AERHASGEHEFLLPLYRRLPVADAVERLAGADIAGFSAYVWNERLSLEIAAALKQARPETVIVFGAPQVPARSEEWLRAHPYVDVAVHGEGEAVFTALLDGVDLAEIPAISFLTPDGAYENHPKLPRIADMATIPSPYLEGTFDPLRAANPHERWIVIWETNRGCTFSCTFCDWGSATQSKVFRFDEARIYDEVEWMGQNEIGFVFCCDANFGMLKRDYEITEAVVAAKERYGFPFSFSVQNTKNATERAYRIQRLLNKSLNAYGVTISLQSSNEETLANIRRQNISSESYRELQRRFAKDGVYTYTDLILGLAGESYDGFAESICHAIADGQHNHVQFHNCSLLPNAEMAQPEYVERFGIRTVPQLIRNPHDAVDLEHEVEEYLETVIATDAMPEPDWVRAKVFSWLADLFYFDRLLQLPLALLDAEHGITIRDAIEHLIAVEADRSPTIAELMATLLDHARRIQAGGPEYVTTPAYGNLIWPADQHALISLVLGGRLEAFYEEVADALAELLTERGCEEGELALREAVALNEALLRVPFQRTDRPLVLSHALAEYHRGLLEGEPISLEERFVTYVIDRTSQPYPTADSWLEHLVWCHGKDKRGYLYQLKPIGDRSAALASGPR